MTYQLPPPEPASFDYMRTCDPATVRTEWFRAACAEWLHWQNQCGVTDRMQRIDDFFREGDLQNFCNVVSWWPKSAPANLRCPTLADMITCLRIMGDNPNVIPPTFADALEARVERVKSWMATKRMDPDNPNETREERAKRMNRERQRAWQLRQTGASDDPELNALMEAARHESEQLSAAKAWMKREIAAAKGAEGVAIAAAKGARAARVSAAEEAVAGQEKRMLDAKAVLDAYKARRINK